MLPLARPEALQARIKRGELLLPSLLLVDTHLGRLGSSLSLIHQDLQQLRLRLLSRQLARHGRRGWRGAVGSSLESRLGRGRAAITTKNS